jgi:hypothetical protein
MRPLPKRKDSRGLARTSLSRYSARLHHRSPSQNPDCVLCARPKRERDKKAFHPPADSFLRVCKPTEGQGWVHLACAVFVPEITFSDAKRLRIVEGISSIPTQRWSTVRNGFRTLKPSGPFVGLADANSELYSDVRCATKSAARSFGVATVQQSIISRVHGPVGTSLALKFKQ